jgi:hypothetical protein
MAVTTFDFLSIDIDLLVLNGLIDELQMLALINASARICQHGKRSVKKIDELQMAALTNATNASKVSAVSQIADIQNASAHKCQHGKGSIPNC